LPVQKAYYKDWPLFREYRKSEEFQRTFEEVFGEPFNLLRVTPQETDILPDDEQLLEDDQFLEDEPPPIDEPPPEDAR
jgi:hypothetical protein